MVHECCENEKHLPLPMLMRSSRTESAEEIRQTDQIMMIPVTIQPQAQKSLHDRAHHVRFG